MTNKIIRRLGRLFFFFVWPGIWLMVRLSPPRTRVLVVCNGEALFIKNWLGSGKWKLPGGGLHRGEDPKIGAVRELREEVGISTRTSHLIPVAEFRSHSNGFTSNIIAYELILDEKPEIHKQPVEVIDYTWCPIEDIYPGKLSSTTQTVLERYKTL